MRISVAICTYNGCKFIEEQLNSIIGQTIKPDEIILSDDGSKDNTFEIAKQILSNSGIEYKLIKNENKHGVVGNFTNAISQCSGDIVFTSDQDDCWLPNKIERISAEFKKDDQCMMVFTDAHTTDANLNPNGSLWDSISFNDLWQARYMNNPFDVLFTKNVVTGATMAFRKKIFTDSLPMPEDSICLHDYWLALVAPLYGKTVCLKEKLIYYRLHGNNVVGAKKLTIVQKIKRWFKNLKTDYLRNVTNLEISEYMINMFADSDNKEKLEQIYNWREFCLWRRNNARKWLIGIGPIIKRSIKGDYKKYSNMFMPECKDIAVCLFRMYK